MDNLGHPVKRTARSDEGENAAHESATERAQANGALVPTTYADDHQHAAASKATRAGPPDLFVVRIGGYLLLHNDGARRVSDVTAQSGLRAYRFLSTSGAFVDFDHDGDLDIVIVGLADLDRSREQAAARALTFPDDFPGAPAVLLQNNGNGTFTDITGKTGVGGLRHGVAIVPTDYDNRRD